MTKKEFKSSEPLRAQLAVLMNDPTLTLALSILRDEATPSKSRMPAQIAGVHYDTVIAHQHYEFAGIQSVLTKLKELTVPNGALVDDEQEFEHMLPDNLKRKQQ